MGIATDTVRNICQTVENTTIGIPEEHHKSNAKNSQNLQRVERLSLDHHLISLTGSHNDGKQSAQGHTHLENPPERTLFADKRLIGQKLVGLEDDIVNLFLEQLNANTIDEAFRTFCSKK